MPGPVRITFLGGLGDIGRNCAIIEYGDRALMLDCGLLFPDEEMPGIDAVLPDLSYLEELDADLVGCICTHGHEDHIGALAHALTIRSFPIYGSPFTLGMIGYRLEEAGLADQVELRPLADGERRSIGPFDCEFVPVTHSVPSGLISLIGTAQGIILHSSDFKLDPTPVDGRLTDLDRIAAVAADPGIRLLLADSTNAELPGQSRSETEIAPALADVFRANRGRRLIFAAFSSHIHRVRQIVELALEDGRFIATLGISMLRNVMLARQLGHLHIPQERLVAVEDTVGMDPGDLCVISTGSQGERRSALALAALGESRWIAIEPTDTVVLSSNPIPGNEARVARVIDGLVRRGARVVTSGQVEVHTTGHGKRDELAVLHQAAAPEWFVPVHGEYRHLVAHAELARQLGMPADRVLVATDGDQLVLDDGGLALRRAVTPGTYTFRHGSIVESDMSVLAERRIIGREGVVVAAVAVDLEAGRLTGEPTIIQRGWVGAETFALLRSDAVEELRKAIQGFLDEGPVDYDALVRRVRRAVGGFVNDRTGRRPMIVPVVVAA